MNVSKIFTYIQQQQKKSKLFTLMMRVLEYSFGVDILKIKKKKKNQISD